MDRTPPTLLLRLRQSPAPADWGRLVDLCTPLLFAWARRCGLQEADAADLVQEVFVLLLRKLPSFDYDPTRSFRAWLHTVALNQWRKRLRRPVPQPLLGDAEPEVPDPAAAFWEEDYRRGLTRRALEVMRQDFQPATWQACWSLVAEGKTAAQIADELGMTIGAVHAARFRVLARLREELAGLVE